MTWDLSAELERVGKMNLSYSNKIIAYMHAYHADLVAQAQLFAEAKAEHTRLKAVHTMKKRYGKDGLEPEKSGEMCGTYADSLDDVYAADVNYRLAEQMVAADKAKLQILHAEIEKWRSEQANERAADTFTARTGV